MIYESPIELADTTESVSDKLAAWLSVATRLAASGDILRILPGTYNVDYGLTWGVRRSTKGWPALSPYTPTDLTLDLTGVTLNNTSSSPYIRILDPDRRRYWGTPTLSIIDAVNCNVINGALHGTNTLGKDAGKKFQGWPGLLISGGSDIRIVDLNQAYIWSDFCYVSGKATRVIIDGGYYHSCGRQGIVFADVKDLVFRNLDIFNAQRFVFDYEPNRSQIADGVTIEHITGSGGGLGFMQLHGPAMNITLDDIELRGDHAHFSCPITSGLKTRSSNLSINNLRTTASIPWKANRSRPALIDVKNWDGVTISNIQENLVDPNRLTRTAGCTQVTLAP